MNRPFGSLRDRTLLPTVLGLSDGILTALTLAAGQLTEPHHQMPLARGIRIAVAALVSSAFVFYVAHYAQLRGELVHAERQLNLMSHGHLASTRLGRSVRMEALVSAVLSSVASFWGALIPLLTGVLLPTLRWGPIVTSLASLGVLGIALARVVHGSYWLWCGGLVTGGVLLSLVGIWLHIV
jgi:predicted membrane protein (TIGR00267 family)